MATTLDYAALVAQKKQLMKGATPEQKQAIKYFIPDTGCAALFGSVSDSEYEDLVKKLVDSQNTYQKAIDKIGLDEDELKEIPPVTLWGYERENAFTRTTAGGSFRSNLYSVTHLFFSATQVYMYKVTLNTMKNEKKERTEEYFYKDITNFSTATESIETLKMGKGCFGKPSRISIEIQEFALIVPGDRFSCATYGDIEASVKAMKSKLREKKQ